MQYYSRFRTVSVFHVRSFSYYLFRPGQHPMQYYSSFGWASVFDETRFFYYLNLPRWTNNHYPKPGLNVVINPYNLALLPTPSIDKAFPVIIIQFSIGRIIKRRPNTITISRIDRTSSFSKPVGVIVQLWNSWFHNEMASCGLFSRQSATLTFGLTIGCPHNRDNRLNVQSVKLYRRLCYNITYIVISVIIKNNNRQTALQDKC